MLAPVLALLAAVIAIKVGVAYAAARLAGFRRADARAIGALMQCGGVMTIAISLDLLEAHVIGARMHATLTLIGLVTTHRRRPAVAPNRGSAAIVRQSAAAVGDDRV